MKFRTLKQLDETEGTVTLHAGHGENHQNIGHEDIVLFPPVSEDPNDPLRWPTWRKYLAFGSICFLTFVGSFSIGAFYPAFPDIGRELHQPDYAQLAKLTSYAALCLGCSVRAP